MMRRISNKDAFGQDYDAYWVRPGAFVHISYEVGNGVLRRYKHVARVSVERCGVQL